MSPGIREEREDGYMYRESIPKEFRPKLEDEEFKEH
jgi:hypothetical protein